MRPLDFGALSRPGRTDAPIRPLPSAPLLLDEPKRPSVRSLNLGAFPGPKPVSLYVRTFYGTPLRFYALNDDVLR